MVIAGGTKRFGYEEVLFENPLPSNAEQYFSSTYI